MRVACFAHLSEISGAVTSLLAMAQRLDPKRFECFFIVPGEGPILDRAMAAGVQAVVLQNPEVSMAAQRGWGSKTAVLRRRISYVKKVARFLKRENIDVAFISSVHSIFAGIAAAMVRKPVVWHVHETIEPRNRATRLKLAIVERLSSALFYDSESGRRAFPAPRVKQQFVQLNWLDLKALGSQDPADAAVLEAQGLRPKSYILSNGVIPRKGADVLLQAAVSVFAKLRGAVSSPASLPEIVITGNMTDRAISSFADRLRQLAETQELRDLVLFPGIRNDLPGLLRNAICYVSASHNEALPIAMVEAMAAGTPVIATDVGDCRAFLENGKLGAIVPAGDVEALASAIEQLLREPEAARSKAALAQQKIRGLYEAEKFFANLEQVLLQIADR